MKILITGVCGFVGFNLCETILRENHVSVIGIDSMNNYYSVKLKNKRLSILKKNKNFKFHKKNINDYNFLRKIFKKNKFDIIYHLAAQAGVRYSVINPQEFIRSNVNGFSNILNLIKDFQKDSKIFYASSSSVYGENKKLPVKEYYELTPKNIYGLSKKFNEEMAQIYSESYKLKIIGLRFFTVFGEWGRPDMFIIKYLQAFFRKKKFFLNNKGMHYRDFTYIKDIISIMLKLSKKKITNHKIFNICSNNPVSLKKIITFFKSEGIKPKIILRGLQSSDIIRTHGDNSLILKEFPDFTFTNILLALKNTLNWYKKNKVFFKKN
jgi:UDP-glucuronate 4-epimerase